ncbi:hypothetical protein DOTSEDRAFT_71641 [Dothistroma septosporum NZE10]|uniref:C2H2-type domain-containing protein n=1 Tax=Dothistroma septosporum (strain NZE10 / CBS 128990) TaxID=675120 RepID=N1PND3_DOTSN|nr:hypothetical protein DOTSEDRAFT_71641 [Dothistroma septosporum NZE10]
MEHLSGARGFPCPICPAEYGRMEHLHRHSLSAHSGLRPFPCPYCAQAFSRRDVLVRHLQTCKAKPGTGTSTSPMPIATHPRGRKRKSCDECARQKKACNGSQPCLPCLQREQPCAYSARSSTHNCEAAGYNSGAERVVDCPPASPATAESSHTEMVSGERRLEFLSHFTSTNGLASSFDCGSVQQRAVFIDCISQGTTCLDTDAPLAKKCEEIVTAIKESLASLDQRLNTSGSWSHAIGRTCKTFFSTIQMEAHLASYWAIWHPNYPTICRGTFSLEDSPAMLLAVMALLGASVSPVPGQRESASLWLDPIEDWVFSAPEFSDDPLQIPVSALNVAPLRERLNALRTAYCVILLQTWEGTEAAKRRARRSRYADIIGVFRSVCNEDITHGDLSYYTELPADTDAWVAFALKEELIRTLTYVVLLDSAYMIFNNTPPRMAPGEARMSLTCPEPCFQADDLQSWRDSLQIWAASELGQRQPLVHQVMSMLCTEQPSRADEALLRSMSSLNFFTTIHPLHVQLFHARCHPLPASQTGSVRRTLDSWRRTWLERTGIPGLGDVTPTRAADCWKRLGFARFAPEFWCLADLILNSSGNKRPQFYDQSNNSTCNSLVEQLLSRYDESDMGQVHALVDLFGNMKLSTWSPIQLE